MSQGRGGDKIITFSMIHYYGSYKVSCFGRKSNFKNSKDKKKIFSKMIKRF